jgi:hypothetical protein
MPRFNRTATRGGRGGRGGFHNRRSTKPTGTGLAVKKTKKDYVKKYTKKAKSPRAAPKTPTVVDKTVVLDAVNSDIGDYFRTNASVEQHVDVQTQRRELYIATLIAFDHYSIEMLANAKARALAAAFIRHDKELVSFLMSPANQQHFGFVDVLKAVTILDSGRDKRCVEKKIERIQTKTSSVMKPKKLGKMRNDVNNLNKLAPKFSTGSVVKASFSGATARLIKKWVRGISEKELEFYALSMPTEPWRKLANLAHLSPVKDFPNAPWFLPFCFGAKDQVVANAKVNSCRSLTAENVNQLVADFDLPYSSVKAFASSLTNESKKRLAERADKLDTLLWYYEDLKCDEVDDAIRARLERNEQITLPYGKLMERLLLFKTLRNEKKMAAFDYDSSLFSLIIPQAESQLMKFKSTVPGPVAILGDASSSMNVAIRTATIISSLLTAICSAKLTFFNQADFSADSDPKNVSDVIEVALKTEASGSTSPAASLVPYFDKRELVRTFIIVTDEEENTNASTKDGRSWRFKDLFMEYRKEVSPAATLIFVSFLHQQHSEGQMYREFVREGVEDVRQFKFNRERPDLTKLDSILGEICSKSSESFGGYVERVEAEIKSKSLDAVALKLDGVTL